MYHVAAKQLVEQLDNSGLLQRSGCVCNTLYASVCLLKASYTEDGITLRKFLMCV